MDCGRFFLTGLRVLQVGIAAGVIGVGAWVARVSHDIEIRGDAILRLNSFALGQADEWRAFFAAVVGSQLRVWLAITAACLTFAAAIFTTMSVFSQRLRANRWFLVALEFLAMTAMAAAFAMSLSLTIRLNPLCAPLDSSAASELMLFELMCPVDTGLSIAAGTGFLLVAITALTSLVHTIRNRHQKSCSFEPTASALGMGEGYGAVRVPALRDNIPTIYDPQKPIPEEYSVDEEKGLKKEAADMGRSDSTSSKSSRGSRSSVGTLVGTKEDGDKVSEISGPMSEVEFEKERLKRPARPWSEVPRVESRTVIRDSLADKRLKEFDFGK